MISDNDNNNSNNEKKSFCLLWARSPTSGGCHDFRPVINSPLPGVLPGGVLCNGGRGRKKRGEDVLSSLRGLRAIQAQTHPSSAQAGPPPEASAFARRARLSRDLFGGRVQPTREKARALAYFGPLGKGESSFWDLFLSSSPSLRS